MAGKDETKNPIQVIERMMKLLHVLSHHHDPVSLKHLAMESGLHPSTAHRILAAMTASGFVERARASCYDFEEGESLEQYTSTLSEAKAWLESIPSNNLGQIELLELAPLKGKDRTLKLLNRRSFVRSRKTVYTEEEKE